MGTDRAGTFGEALRRHRVAAGLTQEELADRAGMSVRGLGYLEKDARQPFRDTVRRLADALYLDEPARTALTALARQAAHDSAFAGPDPSAPRHTPLPPLVGRTQELTRLERHLAGEGPPVLLLAGEPGIGKSRLLAEALERAAPHGWCAMHGGCQRRSGQAAFSPLLEALEGYLARRSAAALRAELDGCAWLVRLLPELAAGPIEPLPGWTLSPEQERRLMDKAVSHFLANVAGPAGTLLVLDDLHWAGADALDLLATLVRSPVSVVRVVGAYRDSEVRASDPLAIKLADLAQAGLAAHHRLPPLSPEEAATLVAHTWAGRPETPAAREVQERVVARAGGVPFFVISCAEAVSAAGGGDRPDGVPWDVAHSIRQRVATLPAAAQEVLGIAAVMGREVQPALLTAIAGQTEAAVLATLDDASEARLLVDDGWVYRFAHDLIREVIEADLGPGRRMALHRSIADALERGDDPAPSAVLAYHYSQAQAPDKAVLYLERSADEAMASYANAMADGAYREVIARLEGRGRARDVTRVSEKLGGVLAVQARYDEALVVLEQAADAHQRVGDLEHVGRVVAEIGRIHHHRGSLQAGLERLRPVRALLAGQAASLSPNLPALEVALARLYLLHGQSAEALAAAERAAALARSVQDERLEVRAQEGQGLALMFLGRLPEALALEQGVAERAEALGDLETLCDAEGALGLAHAFSGRFDQSRTHLERSLEIAQQMGDPAEIAYSLLCLGWLLVYVGDWAQARAALESAVEHGRQSGLSWQFAMATSFLARLCMAEGAWEETTDLLERGQAVDPERLMTDSHWIVECTLAERDLVLGRAGMGAQRLLALLEQPGSSTVHTVSALLLLARAHLAQDEWTAAGEVATRALAQAQATHDRVDLVDALWIQAEVAITQADWDQAMDRLEQGLLLARGLSHPYAEGRLLQSYGVMQARRGEQVAARERLEAAQAIFRRLGARPAAERTEDALADLARS
jgi:tetratricopeptide (TPR) repeat protein/transcriptional regulator with XRE-family HTH domain